MFTILQIPYNLHSYLQKVTHILLLTIIVLLLIDQMQSYTLNSELLYALCFYLIPGCKSPQSMYEWWWCVCWYFSSDVQWLAYITPFEKNTNSGKFTLSSGNVPTETSPFRETHTVFYCLGGKSPCFCVVVVFYSDGEKSRQDMVMT